MLIAPARAAYNPCRRDKRVNDRYNDVVEVLVKGSDQVTVEQKVLATLEASTAPLSHPELKARLKSVHGNTLRAALRRLVSDGRVRIIQQEGAPARFVLAQSKDASLPTNRIRPVMAQRAWRRLCEEERRYRGAIAQHICGDVDRAADFASIPLHFSTSYGANGLVGYSIVLQADRVSHTTSVHLSPGRRVRAIMFSVASPLIGGGGIYYLSGGQNGAAGRAAKSDVCAILRAHLGDDAVRT